MENEQSSNNIRQSGEQTEINTNNAISNNENFNKKGRFGKSLILVKASFKILKQDKEIALFPILSAISGVILLVLLLIPIYMIYGTDIDKISNNSANFLYLFVYYLLSYFIITFFNAGLVSCAQIRIDGKDPKFSDGINNAKKYIGKIFLWSLLSATVGIILQIIADKFKGVSRIIVSLFSIGWGLLTFFIVPVLMFEKLGVISSIKESGKLFKKTWGENVIGNISIGFFFMIIGLLGIIPIIIAFLTGLKVVIISAIILVILYWLILGVISSSLGGIFKTTLYNYAKTGNIAFYNPEIIKSAFKEKKQRKTAVPN